MSERQVHVGSPVTFTDEHGKSRPALVTAVWGKEVYDLDPPSINVVFISDDATREDSYGRQIERHTSVVHRQNQGAHGMYWE